MTATVHPHPAVERMALRRRMAETVEHLLDAVDVLLRELASDEPDADLEPSLGSLAAQLWEDQRRWAAGDRDDREEAYEAEREEDGSAEPGWHIAGRPMWMVDGADAYHPLDSDEDPGDFAERIEVGIS